MTICCTCKHWRNGACSQRNLALSPGWPKGGGLYKPSCPEREWRICPRYATNRKAFIAELTARIEAENRAEVHRMMADDGH